MIVQRAFNFRGGTNGSLEWTLDDEGIKYIVKWEITNRLDNWVKEKLKDTLNLTEDKYLNSEGFCSLNETKANKFFEDLIKILDEQYDYWDSHFE